MPLAYLRTAGSKRTAGFNTSSHHWRKLVGVVDCGVRGSALSRPAFLAAAMSTMPCVIALDIPRSARILLRPPAVTHTRNQFKLDISGSGFRM